MEIALLVEGIHNDRGAKAGTEIICSIDPICSSITLLKGKKNIIVDSGNRGFEQKIITSLQEQGLKLKDVDYVFNTHSHFDHCSVSFHAL